MAGLSQLWIPFLGGTLVPTPDFLVPIATDANGAMDLTFSWPGLSPGATLAFQIWVPDPGTPQAWSASNGLVATAQ